MSPSSFHRLWLITLLAAVSTSGAAISDPAPGSEPTLVDLAKPFATESAWRLTAAHGPGVADFGGNPAPGVLRLCLRNGPDGPCVSQPLETPLSPTGASPNLWAAHYLDVAKPVYPAGPAAAPLLLVVTGSLHAGDGGQLVTTQLLRYDRANDTFARIYAQGVGTNNNQEVRFVTDGPLRGDVISAEPAANRPYGYWMVVSRFTPQRTYRQVLRYRSATLYNDGNSLAVIDSEMPNIEHRLGLWTPGSPLPLPAGKTCPKPTLKHTELWCG